MGLNVYLQSVDSYGYKNASAGTSVKQNITGRSGKRISIIAFGASCGTHATHVYFMQTLGTTSVGTAAASGVASVVLSADASGHGLAADDNVVTVLDNGTYQFRICKSWEGTGKKIVFHDNHSDTIAAGNAVYQLGVRGDTGHLKYKMTASTQNTKFAEIGVFFGEGKGYPMIATLANPSLDLGRDTVDFITVGYMNK